MTEQDLDQNTGHLDGDLSKTVQIITKTVNTALAPVSAFIWGYDKIKEFVSTKVSDRLKGVPPEDIVPPKPHIAVPAIEALRYTGSEEELSDLYVNLLASSMDAKTVSNAHPSFAEIIKQLAPDEAKLMKYFASQGNLPLISVRLETGTAKGGGHDIINNFSLFGKPANCENHSLVPSYLDNLGRLGLIKIPDNYWYTDDSIYDDLRNQPEITDFIKSIELQSKLYPHMSTFSTKITKKQVQITELGRLFIAGCITKHRNS